MKIPYITSLQPNPSYLTGKPINGLLPVFSLQNYSYLKMRNSSFNLDENSDQGINFTKYDIAAKALNHMSYTSNSIFTRVRRLSDFKLDRKAFAIITREFMKWIKTPINTYQYTSSNSSSPRPLAMVISSSMPYRPDYSRFPVNTGYLYYKYGFNFLHQDTIGTLYSLMFQQKYTEYLKTCIITDQEIDTSIFEFHIRSDFFTNEGIPEGLKKAFVEKYIPYLLENKIKVVEVENMDYLFLPKGVQEPILSKLTDREEWLKNSAKEFLNRERKNLGITSPALEFKSDYKYREGKTITPIKGQFEEEVIKSTKLKLAD